MNTKNLYNLMILLFVFLFLGIACTISPWQQSSNTQTATPAPTVAQNPNSDDENAKLKEKLEELEKKVAEQQKQKVQPQVKQTVPIIKSSGTAARVSSPGDGFLALRSEPNSDTGYRILQIPHGATVKILGCQGFTEKVGGRTGRWCRINYDGYTGWAFDGWLVY